MPALQSKETNPDSVDAGLFESRAQEAPRCALKNLLDEGQFGQALILTPFNYAKGRAQGIEFSSTYSSSTWSGYLNLAIRKAKGQEHRIGTISLRAGRASVAPTRAPWVCTSSCPIA